MTMLVVSCNKQLLGPRKITAVGHIEYSASTNGITQVYYDTKDDARAFTMRLNKNYSISGDVSGTWSPSGAQVLLSINGEFGPASPLLIDHGYYETKPKILVQNHEITMSDFVSDVYFIVYTKGTIGSTYYERHFVFE
jgi:hypothetical protein